MKLESIPKIKKENGKEKQIIEQEEKNITSFITKIKEKYPSFEKVIKTPMAIARLLAVFATLQGGQIFAQDILDKNVEIKDPFTLENIHELNTMTLSEIESRLDSSKLPSPQGKVKFSYTFYGKEGSSEKNSYEDSYEGAAPVDTGMVGDVGIYHIFRSINRYDQIDNSNKEKSGFSKESVISEETKVFDTDNKKIEKSTDDEVRKAFGYGNTKQDAIQSAIGELVNSTEIRVRSGTIDLDEEQKTGEVEIIHTRMTTYVTTEGNIIFRNLHIDKIEKEGDGYRAYVSAQKR